MRRNDARHARDMATKVPVLLLALALTLVGGSITPGRGDDARARPPRPVVAWAAGLFETRIAFDGPVDPAVAAKLVGLKIVFEADPPAGGGRAERLDAQGDLNVAAAHLGDDRHTIVLTTDPHPRAGRYTLRLPALGAAPGVSLRYDLSGVEALPEADRTKPTAHAPRWWPTFDPAALPGVPAFDHDRGLLAAPGRTTLTSLLLLPAGPVTIRVHGNRAIEATLNGEEPGSKEPGKPQQFETESTGDPLLLGVVVAGGEKEPKATVSVTVAREGENGGKARPLSRRETLLPWASAAPAPPAPLANLPALDGGDPARGATVFASTEAKCANCHKVRGQGAEVGPDLSTLAGRDRAELYRDIAEPSARIHPNYVPYTVALKDGRVLVGTVKSLGADSLRVTDTEAKATTVARGLVEEIRPSATSIMPVGLAGVLGEARMRDLIAFLTTPPARGH